MLQKAIDFLALAIVALGLVAGGIMLADGDGGFSDRVPGLNRASGYLSRDSFWGLTRQGHWIGGEDAEVVVVLFSNYRCGFCAEFNNTLEELLLRYPEHLAVVVRHYVSPSTERDRRMYLAVECAAEVGSFDEYHSAVFDHPALVSYSNGWWEVAERIGISDMDWFNECVRSERYAARLEADRRQVERLGINATPTFFVNGFKVVGAAPVELLDSIVTREFVRY